VEDTGHFSARSYANAAGQRQYKLYVPSGYDGGPVPFVVMLLGCTQNADDFVIGTQMNAFAERNSIGRLAKANEEGREGFACARRNEEGLLTAVFGLAHLLALASSEKLSDPVLKSLRRRSGRLAVRLARLPGVHAKIGMRALQDCSVRTAGTVAGSSTVAPRYATVEACSCGAG
jgi:hypothetical protein